MAIALVRATCALIALAGLAGLEPALASKAFTGPAGWDHSVAVTPTPPLNRAQESWKKPDGEMLVYLADGGLVYDDAIAMVKKNISDNAIKTSVDTDRKCDGRRAHELEMTFGTTVVHQLIIDDAPGLTKLTYTRPQATPVSPDVTTAIAAYCGATR